MEHREQEITRRPPWTVSAAQTASLLLMWVWGHDPRHSLACKLCGSAGLACAIYVTRYIARTTARLPPG